MIIRNDDISFDSDLEHVKRFCDICDKYSFPIIHAVTPLGITHAIDSSWSNSRIVSNGTGVILSDNTPLFSYLKERKDMFGTHGLWHLHNVSINHQEVSKAILTAWGLTPEYAVLPFNEPGIGYTDTVCGLKVLGKSQRLEDYLEGMSKETELPTEDIVYLHEWRFGLMYTWENLERTLERIQNGLQRSN